MTAPYSPQSHSKERIGQYQSLATNTNVETTTSATLGGNNLTYQCSVGEILLAIEDRRSITEEPAETRRVRPLRIVEHQEPEFFVQQTTRYGQQKNRQICPSCHTYFDSHHCRPTYIGRRPTSIFVDKLNHVELTLLRRNPHFNCPISERINFYRKQFEYLILHRDILRQQGWRDDFGHSSDQYISWAIEALDSQQRSIAIAFTTFNRLRFTYQASSTIVNYVQRKYPSKTISQNSKSKKRLVVHQNKLDPYELSQHIEPFDTWANQYIRDVHSGKRPALTTSLNIIYIKYLRDRNEAIRQHHYLSRQQQQTSETRQHQ